MAKKPSYPLAQVLQVKRRRVDEAEKVVKQRREELEQEETKLKKAQAARDKVKQHWDDKMAQLRHALDTGTTAPKARQMKQYLEIVQEQLVEEDKKVTEQHKQVDQAQRNLDEALAILKQRRRDVDKIESHQKDWEKGVRKELRAEEARVESELGTIIHTQQQRKKR